MNFFSVNQRNPNLQAETQASGRNPNLTVETQPNGRNPKEARNKTIALETQRNEL